MSMVSSLFIQSVGVILGIVIVFQVAGKLFLRDNQSNLKDD